MTLCAFCGKSVDPSDRWNTWQRVKGWNRRGQAGGSDIVLREKLQDFAHDFCIQKQKRNVSANQGTLSA